MAKESAPTMTAEEEKYALHRIELEDRRNRREANFEAQVSCLDPAVAARTVSQRPLYRYKVAYKHPKNGKFEGEVVAHNAADAWAMFCDENPGAGYPSPKMPGRVCELLGPVKGA